MRMTWLVICGLFAPFVAFAHTGSASYLSFKEEGHALRASVALDLRDVQFALGIDADEDGRITWGELKRAAPALDALTGQRLKVSRGGQSCSMAFDDIAVDSISAAPFAVLSVRYECPGKGVAIVESDLMFDVDANHRSLIEWKSQTANAVAILSSANRAWTAPAAQASVLAQLGDFVVEGVWHIWMGFDHLAFLLVLLLPAFIVHASAKPRLQWKRLLTIVTAFTLAHSITLVLAATGAITPPERPIEVAIAASVVVAALLNLFARTHSIGVVTAFCFGLLHGFGFASALQGLGTARDSVALALAGFNIGVETGQLAVVLAVLPLFHWLSQQKSYASRIVPGVSLVIGAVGIAWIVERTAS